MTRSRIKAALPIVLAATAALAAGCAGVSPGTMVTPAATGRSAASGPVPRVQDCGVVSISSPAKYVCGGKVYTTFQLAKLREQEEKKYESGK